MWALAAGLSGVAVLLRMPIQGVAIGSTLGPALLLRALAAAVIGRMESLPRTFGAALGSASWSRPCSSRRAAPSSSTACSSPSSSSPCSSSAGAASRGRATRRVDVEAPREVRPIPRELVRLPEVRIGSSCSTRLFVGFLVLVPLGCQASQVGLFGVGIIMAIVIAGLVILTGWAGQISLGHLAILALGAAVSGSLAQQGKDFFVCCSRPRSRRRRRVLLGIPALASAGRSSR